MRSHDLHQFYEFVNKALAESLIEHDLTDLLAEMRQADEDSGGCHSAPVSPAARNRGLLRSTDAVEYRIDDARASAMQLFHATDDAGALLLVPDMVALCADNAVADELDVESEFEII